MIWRRFLAMFRGQRLDAELDSETNLHLAMLEEEHRTRGLSREEARLATLRDFGGVAQVKDSYRDVRGVPILETLWRDIRFGVRTLTRNPGVTAAVIATLMLGIGANTAVYSVIYSVLLKPLPYREPDRLVWLAEHVKAFKDEIVAAPDFLDWRAQSHSFDSMAAFMSGTQTLTGGSEAIEISTVFTSESLGRILGNSPALGRDFLPGETRPVALITDGLFRRRFSGDISVLGKTLVLNNSPYTLIGVLPPDFRLALPSPFGPQTEADAIVNLFIDPARQRRGGPVMIVQVLGRLKPGVPFETARAELETVRARIAQQFPGGPARELRMVPLYDRIVGGTRRALFVLWAAVGFVLLVACGNVANLLLARATARQRETAIRVALGAGRIRLIRELLTESMILSFAGGVAGLLLAYWGIRLLVNRSPIDIPRLTDATLNWNVLIFSAVVCTIAGMLSGVAPALIGSRTRVVVSASGRRQRLHGLLVISELALALVLLAGAGLMLKSLWVMRSATAVYAPDRVLASRLVINNPQLARPIDRARFLSELAAEVESLSGVRVAAAWSGSQKGLLQISGLPAPLPGSEVSADYLRITPHYFQSAGVRLLAGRWFGEQDQETGPPVAIVNEALVRRFFPGFPNGESPLGRQINTPPRTIVGVVSDFRSRPDADPSPQVFLPQLQAPFGGPANLLVRASSDPIALVDSIRKIVARTSRVDLVGAQTLEERLSASIAPRRFQAALLVTFATVALLLAMVGAYGVLSYSVTQRTHEIGVRLALGARESDVFGMVLGRALRLVAAGVAMGLVASLGLTRFMSSLLYGVKPTDAWTLGVVSSLLIIVTIAAAYLPARRAVRIDPTVALHYE